MVNKLIQNKKLRSEIPLSSIANKIVRRDNSSVKHCRNGSEVSRFTVAKGFIRKL